MDQNDDQPLMVYKSLHNYVGIYGHMLLSCGYWGVRGLTEDALNYVLAHRRQRKKSGRGFIYDFFQNHILIVIDDLFNRPIRGPPGSWVNVVERKHEMTSSELILTDRVRRCMNLGSYNYLGYGGFVPSITPLLIKTVMESGTVTGTIPNELGISPEQADAEEMIAHFIGKEAAMIIPMGFATNSTVIPLLVGPSDLIISDEHNHSSSITGCRFSGARKVVFKHNDWNDLERLLQEAYKPLKNGELQFQKILLLVEGLYSMEGDIPDLKRIIELKKKFPFYIFLDEAHSIGALGAHGRGVCEFCGVDSADIDVMMGTFTKSFASIGGYIAGSKALVGFIRANSFSTVYGSALSPAAARMISLCVKDLRTESGKARISALRRNTDMIREGLRSMGCSIMGDDGSPVIPLLCYHPAKLTGFSRRCFERNIAVVAVGYPATAMSTSRIRFCASASYTKEEVEWFLDNVREIVKEVCVDFGPFVRDPPVQFTRIEASPVSEMTPLVPPGQYPGARVFCPAPGDLVMTSYDFYRFSLETDTIKECVEVLNESGCGSCGPRGFYGTTTEHLALESAIAQFVGIDSCILYSYSNNVITSVIPSICLRECTVLYDDASNFSIQAGVQLSRAKAIPYPHRNTVQLNAILGQLCTQPRFVKENVVVVTESVFINDGAIVALDEIIALKRKYGFKLILDESYSIGLLGRTGRGATEYFGVSPHDVDFIVGSMENAFASMGGFCLGRYADIKQQRLTGLGYCFSAASPPFLCRAGMVNLNRIRAHPDLVQSLQDRIARMFSRLEELPNICLKGDLHSPIIHIELTKSRVTLSEVAAQLRREGIHVALSPYSTFELVPKQPTLRVCVSSKHTNEDIDRFVSSLHTMLL